MFTSTLFALAAAPLTLAGPLLSRAGGPARVPIPDSCTLNSITPNSTVSLPGSQSYALSNSSSSFSPTTDFRGTYTTYSYFLEDDSGSAGWNESAKLQQCLEQCYGFGETCTGVAWGHHVWGYTYGVVVYEIACLFLGQDLLQRDLVLVSNGSWTQAMAVNIDC